MHRLEG